MASKENIESSSAIRDDRELVMSLYRKMTIIRDFELKAKEVFRTGRMPGFIHVYVGEEAIATGVCAQLNNDDYVASTHRGHGHALAKGISPHDAMAELVGATSGCSGWPGWDYASIRPDSRISSVQWCCSSKHFYRSWRWVEF